MIIDVLGALCELNALTRSLSKIITKWYYNVFKNKIKRSKYLNYYNIDMNKYANNQMSKK